MPLNLEEDDDVTFRCEGCGEPCEPIAIDAGIGTYEFWGAIFRDSYTEVVSDCCETTVLKNGIEYTVSDFGDDNYFEEDCD